MSIHLRRDMDRLQRDLMALAGLVEETVHKSVKALQTGNGDLAREVIAGDTQIDEEDNHIHEECLKMLALHQPVASDLRRVVAVMLITTDLERMGDLAEEIAERALHLGMSPVLPVPEKLQRMADITTTMVRLALDSFVGLNKDQAERVMRMDDDVDRYNREIIADLIAQMQQRPAAVDAGLSLFSATRHLERIADHATNIAEDVVYLISGEIIKHRANTRH
ncbi:MAG: phosphate transport system regulatory protein PhoU [Planctomycetia bacterium]|nr:phosphate transport system regulatory protein PhoU [Planctomycetia bacterium]